MLFLHYLNPIRVEPRENPLLFKLCQSIGEIIILNLFSYLVNFNIEVLLHFQLQWPNQMKTEMRLSTLFRYLEAFDKMTI